MTEISLKKVIDTNEIPLLHGPTGSGKTTLIKKYIKSYKSSEYYTFYLMCPLEPDEWCHAYYGIKNNPKKILVIDNLEAADTDTIKKICNYLPKKHKSTIIFMACIDPYAINLRSIRSKVTLISTKPINKADLMVYAQTHNASDSCLSQIAKNNYTDYRLVQNMVHYGGKGYKSSTFVGLRNPFKAFSWLLGTQSQNKGNLGIIIDSDPFFYSMGMYTNYCSMDTNNIYDLEKVISSLSSIDVLGYDTSSMQNAMLARIHSLKPTPKTLSIKFPNFTTQAKKPSIKWNSFEHKITIEYLIRHFNSCKASKKNSAYIQSLIKHYSISHVVAEKCLTQYGSTKTSKLKVHMRKAFELK